MATADTIRALMATQRGEMAALGATVQRWLATFLDRALRDTVARLAAHAGVDGTYTAHRLRLVMLDLDTIAHQVGTSLADPKIGVMVDAALASQSLTRKHLMQQVVLFSRAYEGAERVARVSWLQELSQSRLKHISLRAGRYTAYAVKKAEEALGLSLVQGVGLTETTDRVAMAMGFHRDKRWMSERIVRTEMMEAAGQTTQRGRVSMEAEDPGWEKVWVATMDGRVGADSLFLHGQRVPVDGQFKTHDGRKINGPPHRPNDRCTTILARPEWGDVLDPNVLGVQMTPAQAVAAQHQGLSPAERPPVQSSEVQAEWKRRTEMLRRQQSDLASAAKVAPAGSDAEGQIAVRRQRVDASLASAEIGLRQALGRSGIITMGTEVPRSVRIPRM